MKKTNEPTLDQWRKLYDLAARVKKNEPWECMEETDIFGVKHPNTNETGFVSVMGLLGEHVAVAFYPTVRAMQQFIQIEREAEMDGEVDPTALLEIPKLELSFEDRDMLEKEDLAILKKLGLKFRGAQAYPQFRSHVPGLFPWFFTADEAELMIVVLEQLLDVAPRAEEDADLLSPGETGDSLVDDLFFVREPDGQGGWRDAEKQFLPVEIAKPRYELSADVLAALNKLPRADRAIEVELQMAPLPTTAKRGERPFFPYMLLIADEQTGMLLAMELLEPRPTPEAVFARLPQLIADKFTETGAIPQRLRVRSDRVADLLEPLAEQLHLHLRQSDRLRAIDAATGFMSQQLLGHLSEDEEDDDFNVGSLGGLLGGGLFLPKRK